MKSPRFSSSLIFALGLIQSSLSITIDVTVGGPGVLKYTPSFVNANVGDVIRFTFQQKNHTVTQSTLEQPCQRVANGFDTGFVPVDAAATAFPAAQLLVDSTEPIWVYCRQGNHCQQGMVFAVNPGDKFAAFQAAATGSGPTVPAPPTTTGSNPTLTASYPTSTPTGQPTNTGIDHRIVVGGPGVLAYNPPNITAQIGDTITFEFRQKNHTATASSFESPCSALALTSTTNQIGFDSGFFPVAEGATTFPTYTVRVNDTNPIWVYCRQGNHCTQGMVFSANAVESGPKNFAAFQALAKSNGAAPGATPTPPANGATGRISSSRITTHAVSFVVVYCVITLLL